MTELAFFKFDMIPSFKLNFEWINTKQNACTKSKALVAAAALFAFDTNLHVFRMSRRFPNSFIWHTWEYYIREWENSEQNVCRHSHLHDLWRASPVATVQTRGCLSKYVCAFVCLLRCYCHMNGKAAAMFNFTSWKHLHISKKTHWHLGLDN